MPGVSGADLRYIQQRYLDSDDDDLFFAYDDFSEEVEDDESSLPAHNKEVCGK